MYQGTLTKCADRCKKGLIIVKTALNKAMPNWNFVKRQLMFDKPRYLFTKTHKQKTKTQMFYDKNNALFIYLMEKHHPNMKQ